MKTTAELRKQAERARNRLVECAQNTDAWDAHEVAVLRLAERRATVTFALLLRRLKREWDAGNRERAKRY